MAITAIEDDDDLLRRFVRSHRRKDGTFNSTLFKRPADGAWDNELSFDLARLSTPAVTAARQGRVGFGVAALAAEVPRSAEYIVRHDPNPPGDPDNDAHSVAEGQTDQEKAFIMAENLRALLEPEK